MMLDFPAVYRKKDNAAASEGAKDKDEDGTGALLSNKFKPVTISTQAFYKQVCMCIHSSVFEIEYHFENLKYIHAPLSLETGAWFKIKSVF